MYQVKYLLVFKATGPLPVPLFSYVMLHWLGRVALYAGDKVCKNYFCKLLVDATENIIIRQHYNTMDEIP